MKIFLLSLLWLIPLICFAQDKSSKCDCESYLNWKSITSRQTIEPDSFAMKIRKLDTLNDDGCEENFKIVRDSSIYLLIIPFWNIPAKKLNQVWITKDGELMVTIQSPRDTFNIYQQPDSTSKICFSHLSKKVNLDFLYILGCKGKWLKVEYEFADKNYEGWVHKFSTCSNPCITCN